MPTRPPRSTGLGTRRATMLLALAVAGLALFAASCSSDSGSSDAASSTTDSVATTSTVAPGAELQGAWSVDFTLDTTAAHTDNAVDTLQETWTFTETADGCDPGDAGCLVNSRDDGTVGDAKAVDVDGDGYVIDKTVHDDTLCGSSTGTIHSTRTFSVDDSGQLTGTFHQVITPDDPAECGPGEATYTFTGTRDDSSATTTTSAP